MKAIINTDNYEAFWVDYLDGKLSESDEERLFDFLESNPEISANLIDTDDFMLPAPDVKYPAKSSLKAEYQIENLLIAKIENEISSEDDKFISEKIKTDRKVATAYSAYQKTILIPDTKIVFEGKKYLKKSTTIPLYRYAYAAVAAVAVVFVSGYLLTRSSIEIDSGVKPQFSFIELPKHLSDSSNLQKIENILPISIDQHDNFAYTQKDNSEKNTPETQFIKDVPTRMPLASLSAGEIKANSEYIFMEYRNDIPKENIGFEYDMQITKTPKENRFQSTISKLVQFGKEVDIKGSYDKLKEAKEDLLFTSNE
jgi:hypothetical protein